MCGRFATGGATVFRFLVVKNKTDHLRVGKSGMPFDLGSKDWGFEPPLSDIFVIKGDIMSKGYKCKLKQIDESIARIKGWIEEGIRTQHMLRYFERKRMRLVDKIGRKQ